MDLEQSLLMFVSDLTDVIDETLYLNHKKQDYQIALVLKIIKNYHYINLIYRRKNMKMYNWKQHILIKKYLKDNLIKLL